MGAGSHGSVATAPRGQTRLGCLTRTGDRHAYRVVRDGETVAISPKHLDLLLHLLDHAGDLVTKEALLDAIWPDANVTDNALTQAVSELRQVLGDDPSNPQFIKTVARRGYRFIAPIDAGETVPAASVQQARAVSAAASTPASITSAQEPASVARSIAVLDFVNVTGDPETAWLSAGIAETVTGDLRALGDFRILDRRRVLEATSTFGGSLQAVARETGANLIVVGSFQRSRSRIRITARMVDSAGGEALADAKVDGPIEKIFELQDQIVVEFAREMGMPVQQATGSRIGARETTSLDAYRAFTRDSSRVLCPARACATAGRPGLAGECTGGRATDRRARAGVGNQNVRRRGDCGGQ